MPDDLALEDFLRMNADLGKLFGIWRESREAVDEFKNCLLLMELLAKETRIWLFSKLAASGDLPGEFLTPRAAGAFGTDLNFLQQAKRFFSGLAGSKPEAKDNFVPLEGVIRIFKNYGENYDKASFKRDLERLPQDSHETWLTTLGHFVTCRNLDGHQVSQLDSYGAPIIITERIREFAPFFAEANRQRVPWMVRQAASEFGSYKLRSREDVSGDNHYALHELREKQGFSSSIAGTWYVLSDERRRPVDLFARLETEEQISSAVRRLADLTESVLFDSAENGALLPLIGPAFGSPDQPDSPGARQVVQRAQNVIGDPKFESLNEFLRGVLSDRLNLEIPDFKSASRQSCDIKARLVADLAILASQASKSFGSSLSISGAPLTGRCETLVAQAEIDAISKCIADVFETLGKLKKDIQEKHRIDLGADAIDDFLHWLREEVTDCRLSLTSVIRLSYLVWHSLRWDAPLYPDSQALDLQLYLGTPRLKNTRLPIYDPTPFSSGAALLLDPLKLADYLEGWSKRMEDTISTALIEARRRGWQDPYELVAKAMALCLKMRAGVPLASEIPGDKENVFIVDATFDQRICIALEEVKAPAAVVYPVDLVDRYDRKYPAWAIRRFPPPERPQQAGPHWDGIDEHSILWQGIGRGILYQDKPRIIVIKPFGAPRERIDQLAKTARVAKEKLCPREATLPIEFENIAVKRRYLFDDVSILKDLVRKQDSMPPGFRTALHTNYGGPFDLYFLGYALEEYGRRARMLADVRPSEDDGMDSRKNGLYFSQPPPSGLVCLYLERAEIAGYGTPLRSAMQELELRLERHEREGAKP
ncbi:MAG: hypothetical protein QOI58_3275 [Thermoanaerobaculia bacterium]|jgi:hypothetical protein|nr:hypothetical protein [Thermoanaerobaculia bacterium]